MGHNTVDDADSQSADCDCDELLGVRASSFGQEAEGH